MKRPILAIVGACLLVTATAGSASATDRHDHEHHPVLTVVAGGLHNPRGLAFGEDGRLYVAEAGLGDGSGLGFGLTGSVSVIRDADGQHATTRVLVGGLPSAGDDHGVVGPAGISTRGEQGIYLQISLAQDQTKLPGPIGDLLRLTSRGNTRVVANIGNFDYAWSMQHQTLAPHDFTPGDSNPYGVLAVRGGEYVADAGTNTLDWVGPGGSIKILAYFPNNAFADATPTCIAKGPDGALYVGTLAFVDSLGNFLDPSIPFGPSPKAIVYRVDPRAADPSSLSTVLSLATPWATSLWPINGCAADGRNFYASQFVTGMGPTGPTGDVVAIPFAHPDRHVSLTNGALSFPGGVAVGPDGGVYVSNMSTSAAGQVVRLH